MALPKDAEQRRRFLGGRAAHNARRRRMAQTRRLKLLRITSSLDRPLRRGEVKQLAERFGVHRSTLWRDFRIIEDVGRCPHCGQKLPLPVENATF